MKSRAICWIILTFIVFSSAVEARFPRGANVSSVPTGRVVQNGFLATDTFPFKNFFKSWGAGGSVTINGNNLATSLDANGFPTGVLAFNLGGSLFLPPDFYLGPNRFKWTGTLGGLNIALSMTASSGGSFLVGSNFIGTDGDVTFTVNPLTTSTTSNSIGTGTKTFTVGAGLGLVVDEKLTLAQTSSLTNYMVGTVVSYSGTTLVVNVNSAFGSGTFTSWNFWIAARGVNSFFFGGETFTGLSNIILCRDQDFSTVTSDPFYHKFLSVIATENPLILRPMGDTLNGGTEMQTNPLWAYRKPLTAMSWASLFTFPPRAYAGDSSGVDTLSTGSYPDMPVGWTDKETFLYNTSANSVTINIATSTLTLPKSVVPGEIITLRTTGALPTGLTASNGNSSQNISTVAGNATFYYSLGTGTSVQIAATPGGSAIVLSGTQSGLHSMGPTTARPITAIADNGSGLPRLTLPSTAGLTTNDIVQGNMGNIGAYKITVIDGTHIDIASSYPSGAVLPFSTSGQVWSAITGLSPISDPGTQSPNPCCRSYITTTSINVGSRGAKQIVGTNGAPLPPGNLAIDLGGNGGVNVCVYDAISDMVMCGPGGLYATSMPLDVQVALANRLNKNLWYEFPVTVTDATVTSSLQYIAANLNSNLKVFIAYSNETWNGSFTQYYYLVRFGISKDYPYAFSGSGQQALTASGLRTLQIMQAASSAWTGAGRSAASLRRVISLQAAGATALFQPYLLNGTDLPAPNNASPNRPVDNADIGTWANYWNGVLFNAQYASTGTALQYAGMTGAAADYASGNPTLMASAIAWVYGDVMGTNGTAPPTGTYDFSINSQINTGGTNLGFAPGWETVFASYDAQRAGIGLAPLDMVAYEGGPGLRAPSIAECSNLGISASCADIAVLLNAFKNDVASSTMIQNGQAAFVNPTSFPHTKNGSFLQLEGPNEWSLLPGDFFSTPYQMYNGAAIYNN